MSEHPNLSKWAALAEKQMRGKPLDSLNWTTPEGIEVKPLYTSKPLRTGIAPPGS